jgi:hypothetical protein
METTKNRSKQIVFGDAVVFDCILLIGFIVLVVVAVNYNPRARSIPMALGIIGSIMMLFQLLVDMFPRLKKTFRFVGESGLLAGQEPAQQPGITDTDQEPAQQPGIVDTEQPQTILAAESPEEKNRNSVKEWLKVLRLIAWISAFIVLLGMTHYLIAVGLFVIFVTRLEAQESWTRAIVLATCVDAGFFVLFNLILKAQL